MVFTGGKGLGWRQVEGVKGGIDGDSGEHTIQYMMVYYKNVYLKPT